MLSISLAGVLKDCIGYRHMQMEKDGFQPWIYMNDIPFVLFRR